MSAGKLSSPVLIFLVVVGECDLLASSGNKDNGVVSAEEEIRDEGLLKNNTRRGDEDDYSADNGDKRQNNITNEIHEEEAKVTLKPKDDDQTHRPKRKVSYAKATVGKQDIISRKLFAKPTQTDEEGNEFVIFDDEIISKGSNK
nr:hypothetical protein [Tanacetum cinerariifolium]